MSDLCPQCGNPAYLPSDQCDVIWHTGAKPFGTSVVQDIDAQLAEQIEWVKRLADDLIAAEGREARLEARIKELEGMLPEDNRPCSTDRFLVAVVDEIDDHYDRLDAIKCWIEGAWDEAVEGTTLAELKGQGDE